jgi:hypothetical protein
MESIRVQLSKEFNVDPNLITCVAVCNEDHLTEFKMNGINY